MLERPKGDMMDMTWFLLMLCTRLTTLADIPKRNYTYRINHSCNPNGQAKITTVDSQYQIGLYTVRPIAGGKEITFDYNSVTESKSMKHRFASVGARNVGTTI